MLAAWYLVLTTGVSLHVHTCLGRISAVTIGAPPAEDPCSCGISSYGCCQDVSQTLHVETSHVGSTTPVPDGIYAAPQPLLYVAQPQTATPPGVCWQVWKPDPPVGPPEYILYHRLIYYG